MNSVELFTGAGGLALGIEKAGFRSLATVEWDKYSCDTLRNNIFHRHPLVSNWNVIEGDVRQVDWSFINEDVDLLAGGPPCQPFSLGGLSRAFQDERDMFPALTSVVHELRPRAFIVENVKGLLRQRFNSYYEYILLRLRFPDEAQRKDESWEDHSRRLQSICDKPDKYDGLVYNVYWKLLNAADYGVAQKRERVFIVGFRSDLDVCNWSFPAPTHSCKSNEPNGLLPWVTVRDAIGDLPEPTIQGSPNYFNHELREGARTYAGHTGSCLDKPSKTIKAGTHGVPGGENMFITDSGAPRYYTVREAARIQSFPDDYLFDGAWTEVMRQLGNAVPVKLAEVVASSVADTLKAKLESKNAQQCL